MTVADETMVDGVAAEPDTEEVVLVIADPLPWGGEHSGGENAGAERGGADDAAHLDLLQRKINAYLRFVLSGEMAKKMPDLAGRSPVIIRVVGHHAPSETAETFFRNLSDSIRTAGLEFEFERLTFN